MGYQSDQSSHHGSEIDPQGDEPIRRLGSVVICSASLSVAAFYTWMAFDMPGGSFSSPGAGTWPRIVGTAWIVISLIALFESLKAVRVSPQDLLPTGDTAKRVLTFFGMTIVYVLSIPFVGIYIANTVYAVCSIKFLKSTWNIKATLIGALLAIAISLTFVEVLEVRLPAFPW